MREALLALVSKPKVKFCMQRSVSVDHLNSPIRRVIVNSTLTSLEDSVDNVLSSMVGKVEDGGL
jgi:hypothetical protein